MKSRKKIALVMAIFICSHSLLSSGSNTPNNSNGDIKTRSPSGITATFFSCIGKSESDNVAIAACMSKEEKYQDARLNKSYKNLNSMLGIKERAALVSAERAWLISKSKDEDFESLLYDDEQIDNLQQGENQIFRICERANALEKYLDLVNGK